MNTMSQFGCFSLDDREKTVDYFVGPLDYDGKTIVLRNVFEAMNCAVCGVSLAIHNSKENQTQYKQ